VKKVEGTGSVWNSNSYHWEEKSVAKWSEETLRKIFTEFKVVHEGATFEIKEVKELKGESSLSIRRQRKIVTFDYSAHLLWKCEIE
jgi:activator of HSP90 ATPase